MIKRKRFIEAYDERAHLLKHDKKNQLNNRVR